MNQATRHIGRTLTLVLPVVLVLSGTLAVTRVPWTPSGSDTRVLGTVADERTRDSSDSDAPQEVLRQRLLRELRAENPGVALTHLQEEMARRPALARHCASIARSLGRAAVAKYGGAAHRAQKWSRPVCDTSFAAGVLSAR